MPAGRIAPSLLLAAALAPLPALAGSISAPGYLGGPDSGAATPNPAAAHYNPAALGGTARFEYMVDTQFAFIRVDHTATRNGGIIPTRVRPMTWRRPGCRSRSPSLAPPTR